MISKTSQPFPPFSVRISPELARRVRIYAAMTETTISEIVAQAIEKTVPAVKKKTLPNV